MHIRAYLCVGGNERTVRAIHEETNIPHASFRSYPKAKREGEEMPWGWQTARVAIDSDAPNDGLKALLSAHKPIFPVIKKYAGPEVNVYLRVITKYDEGESPRGFYLSAETILLLSELGAALDNDVVSRMTDDHP